MHSGADLSAAIDGVLGYDAGECKGEHGLCFGVAWHAPLLFLCTVLLSPSTTKCEHLEHMGLAQCSERCFPVFCHSKAGCHVQRLPLQASV